MRKVLARWLGLLLVVFALSSAPAAGQDLVIPGATPLRLRLEVNVDGQPAETAWEAFVHAWFRAFDRDQNGRLSEEEVARMFPLPLVGRRTLTIEYGKLDQNGDRFADQDEVKTYFKNAGFAPVVFSFLPPDAEMLSVGDVLFAQLDLDTSGSLSAAELARAATTLRRVDQNEDDLVTPAELLAASSSIPPAQTRVPQSEEHASVAIGAADADAVLHIALSAPATAPTIDSIGGKTLTSASREGILTLSNGDAFCSIWSDVSTKPNAVRTVRSFYVEQFKAAFGEGKSASLEQLEADIGLQALAGLFQDANRDGDALLSLAELTRFLEFVEQGVCSQATVTVVDQGRNLFELLDRNRDRQLDLRELNAAAQEFSQDALSAVIDRDLVPCRFQVLIERGSPGDSFGPIAIPRPVKRSVAKRAQVASGPIWFQAMDRNRDELVAPWEFPGASKIFRQIDVNGDGAIDVDEARAADQAKKLGD